MWRCLLWSHLVLERIEVSCWDWWGQGLGKQRKPEQKQSRHHKVWDDDSNNVANKATWETLLVSMKRRGVKGSREKRILGTPCPNICLRITPINQASFIHTSWYGEECSNCWAHEDGIKSLGLQTWCGLDGASMHGVTELGHNVSCVPHSQHQSRELLTKLLRTHAYNHPFLLT
jgi:hypothetical protein